MFEKLFYNAEIAGRDHRQSAMLVRGQKIIAVGSRKYCLTKAGNEIQQIDCKRNTIVPGFTDSHCHLVETGDALLQPKLKGRSMADLLIIIRTACSNDSSEFPFIAMGVDDFPGKRSNSRCVARVFYSGSVCRGGKPRVITTFR